MRLTSRGDLVLSASGVLSVNGLVPPHLVGVYAGSACPLDDDRLIYQRCDGAVCKLQSLHLGSLTSTDLEIDANGQVRSLGANFIRAGGGEWAVLWVGRGVRTSGGYESAVAGVWDVDPDGRALVCPQYLEGHGIEWIRLHRTGADGKPEKDASVLKVIGRGETGPILSAAGSGPCVRSLSVARVAYVQEGGPVKVSGIPGFVARPAWEPISWVVPVELDGEVWLLELSDRLTLRPATSLEGIVVASAPPTFGPDVVALGETVARVAWSTHAREHPGDGQYRDIDIEAEEIVDLGATPVEVLPPLDRVPKLDRPFGLACYCFNDAPTLGNLTLMIRPTKISAGPPTFFIATTDDEHLIHDDVLFAIYSGEDAGVAAEDAIRRARLVARRRQRGLVVYQDSFPMRTSLIALLEPGDIAAPQCYRNAGESLSDFTARIKHEYLRVAGAVPMGCECWPAINIHQRYSGPTPTLSKRDVAESLLAAEDRAFADSWPGMVLFRVGTADVPDEIAPYVERLMAGIRGTPARRIVATPIPVPPVPGPIPIPIPPVPKGPAMPYIGKPIQLLDFKVTEEPRDGGKVALKKPNGKYVSVDSFGTVSERDEAHGGDEVFLPDGNVYVAPDRGGKTFICGRFGA